jgi:flagellar basal-body rod protein FlgC
MPGHRFADREGYVMVPDIDTTMEWVNAMQASRAYEANVAAAETTKSMVAQALRLLA